MGIWHSASGIQAAFFSGLLMWFQALSFVIAAARLLKATVALINPGRFYATRRGDTH